jgi:hypothetical protein
MYRAHFPLALASLALLLAIALPAAAYVNGGDYHTTLKPFEDELKDGGWLLAWGKVVVKTEDGDTNLPKNDEEFQAHANELVALAVKQMKAGDRSRISVETKQAIAAAVKEAMQTGLGKQKQEVDITAASGDVSYRYGVKQFSSYWETNYKNEGRKRHAARTGYAAFVAIKLKSDAK